MVLPAPGAVREAMSEVYVHQDEQETTKKAPYLRPCMREMGELEANAITTASL